MIDKYTLVCHYEQKCLKLWRKKSIMLLAFLTTDINQCFYTGCCENRTPIFAYKLLSMVFYFNF